MSRRDLVAPQWRDIVLSALCLLAATNGPAVALSIRILNRPFLFEDWPFNFPIHVVGAVGVWRLGRLAASRRLGVGWQVGAVAALAAWMVVSMVGSRATELSSERTLIFLGMLAFGVTFGTRPTRHQLLSVFLAANAATIASAVLIVVRPQFGRSAPDPSSGEQFLQGIFANRNSLGPACALALIATVGVLLLRLGRAVDVASLVLLALNVWLLVGSRSATPLIGLAAAAACVGAGFAWRRWRDTFPARLFSLYAAVVIAVAVLWRPMLNSIGRDSGLSDRTDIWGDVVETANSRPVFGHGYWAFWDSELAWGLYERHGGFQFGSAHNSFFEMALGNGWPGAFLFALLVASAGVQAVRAARQGGIGGTWLPAVAAFTIVEHATESFVLYHSYLLVLLVGAASVNLGTDDAHEPGLIHTTPTPAGDPADLRLAEPPQPRT